MEQIKTNAIVLQKIQIKDFKFILKLYTHTYGLLSANVELNHFIPSAYLQPPNICDVLILKNKYGKFIIKDIKPTFIYKELYADFRKNIIAQLIVEILIKSMRDELIDKKMFHFIQQSFIQLDGLTTEKLNFFHIHFLKQYIQITGFMPLNNYDAYNIYFDLKDGKFIPHPHPLSLNKENSELICKVFFHEIEDTQDLPVLNITHHLLDYIKCHLGIQHIQTLTLLKEAIMEFNL